MTQPPTQNPGGVLVHFRCPNNRQAGWLITQQTFTAHSSGGWSPRAGQPRGPVTGLVQATGVVLCPLMAEGARELCEVSFPRARIPFRVAGPSQCRHPPDAPSSRIPEHRKSGARRSDPNGRKLLTRMNCSPYKTPSDNIPRRD